MTLKQLRALRAVVDHGSITAAAEALSLTPPAVHTQLRTLEENLCCRVFERGGGAMSRLTVEGAAVLDAEGAIERALAACMQKVQALRSGKAGVVVLGVISTAKYFAPRLVARLHTEFPDIDIVLRIGNRDTIVSELQQRSVELAIMGRPPRHPIVTALPFGPHPHVIIAPPGHPLAVLDDVPPDRLLAETFIAREIGSGTRIMMMRYLDRIGEGAPYHMIEMGSNETIKQAVMAGLGLALISQHTVTEELRGGRLVAIRAPGLPIERAWYLLHREDLTLTPTLETVRDYIAAHGASFLPSLDGDETTPAAHGVRVQR